MSKMREAFEKWWASTGYYASTWHEDEQRYTLLSPMNDSWVAWQAAIADVKADGPVLERLMSDPFDERDGYWWDTMKLKSVKVGDKIYKLPEDEVEVTAEPEHLDPDDGKSAAQLRAEGRPYCPKCYTFGYSHRRDCHYKNEGMTKHVKEQLK